MVIETYSGRIIKIHVALIFILLCANALGIVFNLFLDHDYVYGLVPLFDFNSEKNIPTLFSSIILIICSALLYLMIMNNKKTKLSYIPWLGLALIFLFLSIDEINSIHERFASPTRETFEASGFLCCAWVIPYGAALIVFIVSYAKFLFDLPKNIIFFFLASGLHLLLVQLGSSCLAVPWPEIPENTACAIPSFTLYSHI